MEERLYKHIDSLVERYPKLAACKEEIIRAYEILQESYSKGKKLLVCGNGGSASDSEHIVGELMKGFLLRRKIATNEAKNLIKVDPEIGTVLAENLQSALPSISLTAHTSLSTAYMNDCMPELVYAQQVNGYGEPGDTFLGISTSGNSANIVYAAVTAKAKGLKVMGLTGEKENKLQEYCDVCIHVPETETYKIQELHLPVYHTLCMMLEDHFFGLIKG